MKFINLFNLTLFIALISIHASLAKNNTTTSGSEESKLGIFNQDLDVRNVMKRKKLSVPFETKLELGLVESKKDDIKFYVYPNPKNPDYVKEVTIGNLKSLKESGLVNGPKIHIVTHGFLRSIEDNVTSVKNAFLRENFKNIVLVDWSKLSTPTPNILPFSFFFYFQAKNNTLIVGQTVSEFIRFCIDNSYGESYDNFHLIGHSLGAHVMGIAGLNIYKTTGNKVGRITGLDPTDLLYAGVPKKFRLSKDDARFVDAIHTDTDAFGTPNSIGTVDFYTNGGLGDRQPDCVGKILLDGVSCSHETAFTYYIKSILGQKYYGCKCRKAPNLIINTACPKPSKCPSPVLFGEFSSETITGNYYVDVD